MTRRPAGAARACSALFTALAAPALLVACGGGGSGPTAVAPSPLPPQGGACYERVQSAYSPDAATTVLLVKQFRKGDPLVLADLPDDATPRAAADTCVVKLLVGPGNPGPAGAPSTSAGIGIEVWLPDAAAWNERIRVYGNGGFSGSAETSLEQLGEGGSGSTNGIKAAAVAQGYVVATSDNGHIRGGGAFLMNPDGTINTVLWQDFAERSLRELALQTKALSKAFYGKPHRYAYWDGFSSGGRQGLKNAQRFAEHYDGILAGAPAIHWTRFTTGNLYPQIVMRRDLGGTVDAAKLRAVSLAAVNACGGGSLGFLLDPFACRYDPATDPAVLCSGVAGRGGTTGTNAGPACVNLPEATAINKIWYGQTLDGTAPDPAADNGSGPVLGSKQLWFGVPRGASLATVAGPEPSALSVDQVALQLQDPAYGAPGFVNAVGNGLDRWKGLSYAELADAAVQGLLLQPRFSDIDTDDPNLGAFNARGGKLIVYHGLADTLIPPQGSVHYHDRVVAAMGGEAEVRKFSRFYLVPGLAHTGAFAGTASVPLPQPATGRDELFKALRNWVENGVAPERIEVTSPNANVSLPLCVYPRKATYRGSGAVTAASSYVCG